MANVGLAEGALAMHRFRGGDHPLEALTFGNVREHPRAEIWRSHSALAFRKLLRERIDRGASGPAGLPLPCRSRYMLFEV
jgi:hypothetical protein